MSEILAKIKRQHELKCGRFSLPIGERTLIMGILNRTPDSFSDGGKFLDEDSAIRHIMEMVEDGSDIVDIGGESSRPGSEVVTLEEELRRTIPIIKKISPKISVPISIDTTKHEVALQAIKSGASIINDISGLKHDPEMARVIAGFDATVVLMHIKGTPKNMQDNPVYSDLMSEIIQGLKESIDIALANGIDPDKIVIDPGIGFGKNTEHNLIILNRLAELKILGKPILIGPSRKSFIGNVLGYHRVGEIDKINSTYAVVPAVRARTMGTAAACVMAIANGACIIRVHDVKEMLDVARIADAIKKEKP